MTLKNGSFTYRSNTLLIFLVFINSLQLLAQAPAGIVIVPGSTEVSRLGKFEAAISFSGSYTNPYDYDDIDVQGIFISPAGKKDTVDGFFMQDYSLNTSSGAIAPTGQGIFKIRYAPRETGTWKYSISVTNPLGNAMSTPQTFECSESAAKGFIRKNATNYLGFDDGSQYIPVGQNQAWQQNNIYLDYKSWLQKLSDNKANTIRIWQAVWGFGIEWKNGTDGYLGLGKYKQSSAYYTDWLLDECRSKGIYIMFCLNHHGMVSSGVNPNWPESPYNSINGGPCANTWDFFINGTAKNLHKNRLRYTIARWGYSQSIMAWELFNEVDWTDNFTTYKDAVKDWHIEMANYIRSHDVYRHLVTTSYANPSYDGNTWNSNAIDFTQTHNYVGSPNVESVLASASDDYVNQYHKPTLNGEFGIDAGNISLSTIDPNGIYVHNSIWATAFSGAMGAGMSWWWDNYIDPQNLYRHYKPLSEFIASIPLLTGNYKKTQAITTGGGTSDLSLSPGVGFDVAGASSFTIDPTGAVSPSAAQLSNYLFGNTYNTQYRKPPSFTVTYPVAGQFKVLTGTGAGTSPRINIYLDGNSLLDQNATVSTTDTISVPAGQHTIKVDNLGIDWISISSYTFTNIGSALNSYVLRNSDSTASAGWIHNKKYNWQVVKNTGVPAPVNGATISIPHMTNGLYAIQFTDCSTGAILSTVNAAASGNTLVIALPTIDWDLAFTAVRGGVTPVDNVSIDGPVKIYPNPVTGGSLYLSYAISIPSQVRIDLFDMAGKKVANLYRGRQTAGAKVLQWNGKRMTPGTYIVQLVAGTIPAAQKVVF